MENPGLAIIANCLTPYRVNLHRLIAAGVPELTLHTLITHGAADFQWNMEVPPCIRHVFFSESDDSPLAAAFHAPWREWRKGGRLIRYLHENKVKAVICNNYRYLSFLRVIDHCYRAQIPLFVNNDSNARSERRLSPFRLFLKRRMYSWWLKRTAGVMPMGELGEQFFQKYGGCPSRFYRVPYTPDYDTFAAVDPERLKQFRQTYRLSHLRRYLLFSGRLVRVKRVDLLLEAFASLAAKRPQWDLLIAGEGPLREKLERSVPEEIRTRVIWTGFLEQDALNSAYHSADVLVLPSDREPWAVVVQEAMAAGLAVVASEVVGAAYELIVDGKAGRLFTTGSVESLRHAILDATAPDQIDQLKRQAPVALAEWRLQVDPVSEVRRALTENGILRST